MACIYYYQNSIQNYSNDMHLLLTKFQFKTIQMACIYYYQNFNSKSSEWHAFITIKISIQNHSNGMHLLLSKFNLKLFEWHAFITIKIQLTNIANSSPRTNISCKPELFVSKVVNVAVLVSERLA
jgi:hypothetical protein